LATTDFGHVISIVIERFVLLTEPLQLEKLYPGKERAVRVTTVPWLKLYDEGKLVTTLEFIWIFPLPTGLTLTVRLNSGSPQPALTDFTGIKVLRNTTSTAMSKYVGIICIRFFFITSPLEIEYISFGESSRTYTLVNYLRFFYFNPKNNYHEQTGVL